VFTGIVEELGTVDHVETRGEVLVLRLRTSLGASLSVGASIAVNGCCLTATQVQADGFTCELTQETLARTGFTDRLRRGRVVNLERPLRADGRLDGHIVQGHVDGVGRVTAIDRGLRDATIAFAIPAELERYLVPKGSIAVDGISLTVASLEPGLFTVAVIPHTLAVTSLGHAAVGDVVCLEVDLLAKYVERLLGARRT
jgi:riboflavin synthase